MVTPARAKVARYDPTVYPVEDEVGEDLLQRLIAEMLRPLLAALFASRRARALVGADQFIYWKQFEPTKVIAPDVYVLPGVDPGERVRSWKVWETGIVPSFALEIVSNDNRKDEEDSPRRYDELGTNEVVIFDPDHATRKDSVRFRVYRRVGKRGLTLIEATNADRVHAKSLSAWLVSVGEGMSTRLRVGVGPKGEDLLPTDAERATAEAARATTEAARATTEAARATTETLRATTEALRATTEALRAKTAVERANTEAARANSEREARLRAEAALKALTQKLGRSEALAPGKRGKR